MIGDANDGRVAVRGNVREDLAGRLDVLAVSCSSHSFAVTSSPSKSLPLAGRTHCHGLREVERDDQA